MEKTCSKCGVCKPVTELVKGRPQCKACRRLHQAAYRVANREKIRGRGLAAIRDLAPSYVASNFGLSVRDLTPGLLALLRERILNTRVLRDLNKTLKELNDAERIG